LAGESGFWNARLPTDLQGRSVLDLGVPRNGFRRSVRRVHPQGMSGPQPTSGTPAIPGLEGASHLGRGLKRPGQDAPFLRDTPCPRPRKPRQFFRRPSKQLSRSVVRGRGWRWPGALFHGASAGIAGEDATRKGRGSGVAGSRKGGMARGEGLRPLRWGGGHPLISRPTPAKGAEIWSAAARRRFGLSERELPPRGSCRATVSAVAVGLAEGPRARRARAPPPAKAVSGHRTPSFHGRVRRGRSGRGGGLARREGPRALCAAGRPPR